MMGLDNSINIFPPPNDSIDALIVWDNGIPGVLEPGIDYALFSFAPGSCTLWNLFYSLGYQSSAAAIFLTDFQGYFYLYLFATDLGVGNNPNVGSIPPGPLPVIWPELINVDAADMSEY